MELQLSLWNIHDWLDERGIEHFYTLEDELPLFKGIRFRTPDVDQDSFAVVYDVTDNNQYRSILSFQNGRIYFRFMLASEAMNLLNEMLFIYADWQKKLTSLNLSHASPGELLSCAASLFHLPIIVIKNNKIVARTENAENWDSKELEQKLSDLSFVRSFYEALKNARASDGILLLQTTDYGQMIMGHFPCRSHYVLLLTQAKARKATQADLILFRNILHAVSINLKIRGKFPGRYNGSVHYAFSSFADGSEPSPDSLRHVLKKLGWQYDDIFQVFCVQFKDQNLQPYPALLYTLLRNHFSCCYILTRKDRIFLFLNVSRTSLVPDESAFIRLLPADLLYIGQSNPYVGISNLPFLIHQTEQALIIARQTGNTFVNTQAISTQAILKKFYSDSSLQAMVHPAVVLLSELDNGSKAGFDYLNTLEVFLMSGANISAASRKLHLHRNSFINRLERIKELTGLSLTDPKELETLLLSIIIFNRHATEFEKSKT